MINFKNKPIEESSETLREIVRKAEENSPSPEFDDESPLDCDMCERNPENRESINRIKASEIFIDTWKHREEIYDGIRKKLMWIFIVIMSVQLVALNVLIFLNALGYTQLDQMLIISFCTEVFAQIIAIIFFMVKYLFNRNHDALLDCIINILNVHKDTHNI